mgnify:CR=1
FNTRAGRPLGGAERISAMDHLHEAENICLLEPTEGVAPFRLAPDLGDSHHQIMTETAFCNAFRAIRPADWPAMPWRVDR